MKTLQLSLVTLIASAVGAWAASTGPARIQGVVVDSKKNPVAGAEVHITAKDGSGLQKIARTDGGGQYGVSITDAHGILGKYRYLLFGFVATETDDDAGNTFYSEIDVVTRKP